MKKKISPPYLARKFFDSDRNRFWVLTTLDCEVTSTIFDEVSQKESENLIVVFRNSKVFPEKQCERDQ